MPETEKPQEPATRGDTLVSVPDLVAIETESFGAGGHYDKGLLVWGWLDVIR